MRCEYWNGCQVIDNEINLDEFEWWCPKCEMAVKDKHVKDGVCPNCENEVLEMDYQRGVWDEYFPR